jgi:hypothetical protein
LYKNILDRDAESQEVIDDWTHRIHSSGVAHVIGDFFGSPEYRAKSMSTDATVDKLYLSLLGRSPEPEGKIFWVKELNRGMPLRDAAEGFVGSREYRQKIQAGTSPLGGCPK